MTPSAKPLFFVGPWDLNENLACIPQTPDEGTIVLIESVAKSRALPYHAQKLVLVLSSMHHFAEQLRARGYDVRTYNAPSYIAGLRRSCSELMPSEIRCMKPREWGLFQALKDAEAQGTLGVPLTQYDDGGPGGHFLLTRAEFEGWAGTRKQLRMADFYAWMRKRTGYLMNGNSPEGGKWSFDEQNRKKPKGELPPPKRRFEADSITRKQMRRVNHWRMSWGHLAPFDWPVTREAALEVLSSFFDERAQQFGPYQDAMLHGEPFMWHSLLATAMNLSLVSPREVCERIVQEYRDGRIGLPSAEGLLRQVLGWREFVRGVYWRRMPGLRTANHLGAKRHLPAFYWDSSRTDMACMNACVEQVERTGYAHHIQRLMVLGNYALLAEVSPRELSHWFWATFVDAYEWVELPNVVGMASYGDPTFTTKPYAASGNYINKMSNYCRRCPYDVKRRFGEAACPFNSLYWAFMVRHRRLLEQNPRMRNTYRLWDGLPETERSAILESARAHMSSTAPPEAAWTFDDDAC